MERTLYIDEATNDDGETLGVVDRGAALATFEDLEAVLFTLGGVAHIAAKRVQTSTAPNGKPVYTTIGYLIQWDSFAPAAPADAPAPAAVPEPDDELTADELEQPFVYDESEIEAEGDGEELDELDLADRGIPLTPEA